MNRLLNYLWLVIALQVATASAQTLDEAKQEAFRFLEEDQPRLAMIGDAIFSYSELGFQEFKGSKLLTDLLEKEGFTVERGVAGMPTAFVATYGSGHPVIGLMADIDGLPMKRELHGYEAHVVQPVARSESRA